MLKFSSESSEIMAYPNTMSPYQNSPVYDTPSILSNNQTILILMAIYPDPVATNLTEAATFCEITCPWLPTSEPKGSPFQRVKGVSRPGRKHIFHFQRMIREQMSLALFQSADVSTISSWSSSGSET